MWTFATKNSQVELKLTGRKFHIHSSGENRQPSCQRGMATDTAVGCTDYASQGHKWKKRENQNVQDVVGVPSTVGLENCFFFTNHQGRVDSTKFIKKHLLISLFSQKKNLLWTISTSSWAHCHGNVPKRESQNVSVCAKGHMNYGLTLTEGLILIDPELIIFGRPQSLPVSRCYNFHPESISPLAATPATGSL